MRISYNDLLSVASMTCLLAGAVACGASGADGGPKEVGGVDAGGGHTNNPPTEPPVPTSGDFVYPKAVHTGFDGTRTFKVPVTSNVAGAQWSIADPSIATIVKVPQPADYGDRCDIGGEWAMVTAKKAGTTTIIAKTADKTATATLVVQGYAPANYAAGDKRYNAPDNTTAAQRTACADCHLKVNGVDHSPFTMAGYVDDEMLSAITTGVLGTYQLTGVNHAWNLTDAEKQGIMPYLRALPPRGF